MNSNSTAVDVFNSHRPLLFSIAYRMLGSVTDAEDILQEAYLRWERASDEDVRSPQSYLTTIVTRLSIDQLRKEKSRRETYIGAWLPEPLMTSHNPNLSGNIELAESLSVAFLLLLETLAPVERAVDGLYRLGDPLDRCGEVLGRDLGTVDLDPLAPTLVVRREVGAGAHTVRLEQRRRDLGHR